MIDVIVRDGGMRMGGRCTTRTTNSTPPSILDSPIVVATHVANEVVNSVVVLPSSSASVSCFSILNPRIDIQFREDAIERSTCATSYRKHDPLRLLT